MQFKSIQKIEFIIGIATLILSLASRKYERLRIIGLILALSSLILSRIYPINTS